jgi:transposase
LPENVLQGEKFEDGESTMGKQIRADYEQILMFPPSVEDWVAQDHPARFIRDFVDSLDLSKLGIEIPDSDTGRPPYAPDLLLKVWLYGYFNRIRATRKLEKACLENMGLIWLTGMNAPDHNSLWRFFKANKKSLRRLFKQSIRVALKADLIGLALHAVDGTKVRTLSANERVRDRKHLERVLEEISERLDRTIGDAMAEIERAEREESGEYRLPASMQDGLKRKQRIQEALKELDASEKKVVHPSEPEARFMKNRRTKDLSYNAQAVADEKSGLIVAQDVVTEGVDYGQLVAMLDKVEENLGAVAEETVADGGYFSSGQIGLAEERKYEVLVAKSSGEIVSERGAESDPYHHCRFVYDQERDCCVCPEGRLLPFYKRKIRGKNNEFRRYRCRDFQTCPHRWKCSDSKNGRIIDISVHHEAVERHRSKREKPENQQRLKARKKIIEPVFAWIKRALGFRRWTVAGIENVKAQWDLICTTINLRKLYKHWVSGELVFS